MRANAARYRLDAGRFVIMGNSSGGWVATMAALTGGVPELEGEVGVTGPSSRVRAAVDFYGPTDFLQMDAHMPPGAREEFNALLGLSDCHDDPLSPESLLIGDPIRDCRETVALANPVTHVTTGMPPLLILHGQDDRLVPALLGDRLEQQRALVFRSRQAGDEDDTPPHPARPRGRRTACGPRNRGERHHQGAVGGARIVSRTGRANATRSDWTLANPR
ncbi:hypothetical protein ACQEVF_43655 [Nonomuraea polychroma]|uniref:hypothetical protein n=1 Tax=Nonomuraea polychroma TaxID=46176 RepID=UPI003D8A40BC